ncbi:DUF4192 domain-containing protein [Amycolatopsis sp. NBC_00355]|uniref:DUF4192 domain-containing protein n=1 Tax=Amycolatopsis sp. NBC_00355 TaxID=2975957 RepID=UPI002E26B405
MSERILLTDDKLLAAIPALLGFSPADALVIVAATVDSEGTVRMGPVNSFALDTVAHQPVSVVAHLERALGDAPLRRIIGAVVHDNGGAAELPYRAQLATFTECMRDCGFTNIELLHVNSFTPGVTWSCYEEADHTGTLTDPAVSPITTHVITQGRRIYDSREDFLRQFTPVAADIREGIQALADPIANEVDGEEFVSDFPRLRDRLTRLDDAVTAATHGHLPADDHVIADLLASLSGRFLRDIQLTQSSDERAAAAQSLWLHLWRHAAHRYAPTMAGVVAMTAYLQRDGATAGAVIDTEPQLTRLGQMVRALLRHCVDPATVLPGLADITRELRAEAATNRPQTEG